MANALERAAAESDDSKRVARRTDSPAPAPEVRSDVAELLAGVRQETSNELLRVFDEATRITGATMGEAMWTVAMLQARILASADLGETQEWVAGRFHELVRLALPGMMMAVEKAKRDGKPPNDA